MCLCVPTDKGEIHNGPGAPAADQPASLAQARLERALAGSLRLAIIPVVFMVAAGLGAYVYAAALFVHSAISIGRHPFPVGHQIGLFLLDIDLFLIGATLLVAAIGLYELFVRELPAAARLPAWLEMHDLNDLKGRVIAMVVLVIAVSFAEVAVDVDNGLEVLELGGGIAVVVVALTAFLRLTGHTGE
jgi:uncharacterized membrane protein YqhA